MARASRLVFFERRNECKGEHYIEQGAFTECVNAFGFTTRSTCQQRFQMTHFVFTQCKFATASLDLADWVLLPYVVQEYVSFAPRIKILSHEENNLQMWPTYLVKFNLVKPVSVDYRHTLKSPTTCYWANALNQGHFPTLQFLRHDRSYFRVRYLAHDNLTLTLTLAEVALTLNPRKGAGVVLFSALLFHI